MWVCQYRGVVLFRRHDDRLYLQENVPWVLYQTNGRGYQDVVSGQNSLHIVGVSLFERDLQNHDDGEDSDFLHVFFLEMVEAENNNVQFNMMHGFKRPLWS